MKIRSVFGAGVRCPHIFSFRAEIPPVTSFGKPSRLRGFDQDRSIASRLRQRSRPQPTELWRDGAEVMRAGGSTSVSPVTRSLDVTVALQNSRAPGRTDTNRTKGSRSGHARGGVEPIDRIPPAEMNPSDARARTRGSSRSETGDSGQRAATRPASPGARSSP
jgi:hypothetical protein